ncbi:MAG: hypothetical protein ACOC3S_00835 [Bacteroidota bacterium]
MKTCSLVNLRYVFYSDLMHFAARQSGFSYGEFASDFKVLVASNLKALKVFLILIWLD